MQKPIIDSELTETDALLQNPTSAAPEDIIENQRVIRLEYYSFDALPHVGQIVIHKELEQDIKDAFELMKSIKFPVYSIIPVAHSQFHWDDIVSVTANNTSGFNYRNILNSDKISYHAFGRAIDINPKQNPYIINGITIPKDATYNPSMTGTLAVGDPIVTFSKKEDGNGVGILKGE